MSTRRRDRRNPGGPTPTARLPAASSRSHHPLFSWPLILVAFFALAAIVLPLVRYRGGKTGLPEATSAALSVYERGLVKPNVAFQEILAENSRFSENRSRRHFPNPVLAYVTPWNSRGSEMAKLFNSKLTHLSPVWYELKSEGKRLVLEGRHNADRVWISKIRTNGNPLVLPRVVLEAFPVDLLLKKKWWSKAIDIIIKECKDMGYDGIVLESWSRWAAHGILHDPDMRNMGLDFIKELSEALHSMTSVESDNHPLELIYDLKVLILLGLNFYGNDFLVSEGSGGGAITGTDYISLLEKHRPVIHWDNTSAEHFFIYSHNNARHAVFYPSLLSLSMRLDEAQVWGAGLSIWEIGQGLDYFFDLL
ncbi:hypothetical protein OPV22_014864 [Ensete ventricosum]|uniref:Chitinase domain-containing protein 1 n=1 Tax=Ensete ventricosum TaxID=4639 RepID=A0AAV8R485_ENSVE|nr:hypothetical protein OPV22_014864 [Ensete ventricosum]